jgi:hypothetical protein
MRPGDPVRARIKQRLSLSYFSSTPSLDHIHSIAISCRAPRREPSLPLERALWREARGLSLCVRGGPPSRDVRPRDAWPLPHGA